MEEIKQETFEDLLLKHEEQYKKVDFELSNNYEKEVFDNDICIEHQHTACTNPDFELKYVYGEDNSFGKSFMNALKLFRNDVTVE